MSARGLQLLDSDSSRNYRFEVGMVALIALAAALVNGYHLGGDDAAIYVPGIEKAFDPALFPSGSAFFGAHAGLSFFPLLIGGTARFLSIPIDTAIFAAYLAFLFLTLLGARYLLRACFRGEAGRWTGVGLLAATMGVPVAGTALILVDPYLTARSLSTPASLFAMAAFAEGQWRRTAAWVLVAALVHPLMSAYLIVFLATWWAVARRSADSDFVAAGGIYHGVLLSHPHMLVSLWRWYEWIGAIAPAALLAMAPRALGARARPCLAAMCQSLVLCCVGCTMAGLATTVGGGFEMSAPLQPMRIFHLAYLLLFLFLGGAIGEFLLRRGSAWARVAKAAAIFAPLAAGMFALQLAQWPASPHIEWPGRRYENAWLAGFQWIRANTPKDALFALDPDYMLRAGEDMHGFRAIAQRGSLADRVKDSGVVSLFPSLADEWAREVHAQDRWTSLNAADFATLANRYHVGWVVLEGAQRTEGARRTNLADCPYTNAEIAVCRLPPQSR